MAYTVRRADEPIALDGAWHSSQWALADTLDIDHFHPKSSDHHPRTQARMLYDDTSLHLLFRVRDRYVRAVAQSYQDSVCQDSCVEFFFSPNPGSGQYFNIEINCGGVLLLHYGRPLKEGPREELPLSDANRIEIYHSLPARVEPELTEPTEWVIQLRAELALFTQREGLPQEVAGTTWDANLYKCADATSHPHWASWAPIGETLSFHQPHYFAPIHFEP
jgi:hypothetical protein